MKSVRVDSLDVGGKEVGRNGGRKVVFERRCPRCTLKNKAMLKMWRWVLTSMPLCQSNFLFTYEHD